MFKSRISAAESLLEQLSAYKDMKDAVIVAIPRGALPIGELLATELHLPLDVVLSKKIGAPNNKELAIGAVSLDSISIHAAYAPLVSDKYIATEIPRIQKLLQEQYRQYHNMDYDPSKTPFKDKVVIIVDDGISTGRTFIETIKHVRKQKPQEIIAAIPVIPADTLPYLERFTDKVISLITPTDFKAVGQFYEKFPQVSDQEAIDILQRTKK